MQGLLDTLRNIVRRLRMTPGSTYRPELHYMRGPGPATRRRAPERENTAPGG